MPVKSDILDMRAYVHHMTERAVLVSEDNDVKRAVWLPLSQIDMEPAPRDENGEKRFDLQIPQKLAEEKGLV